MRKWIDLTENEDLRDIHPHLRGEQEWFSFLWGTYWLNVDQCREGIANGTIKASLETVNVIQLKALLGMSDSDFGSNDFDEPMSFDLMAAATSRKHMTGLPEEKLLEPAIIVMWKTLDGMKRAGYKIDKKAEADKPAPWIVDGNHRLSRLFLQGYDQPIGIYVVPHEEALKFAYDRHRRPILKKGA